MKNRYLLVLTLIFGLTGQMAQTADTLEKFKSSTYWPTVSKTVFNALPKDHTIAKTAAILYAPPARLTEDKEIREETYQKIHHCLAEQNIKPQYANWYLKTAENLMLAEGGKYDPEFASRFEAWGLATNNWAVTYTYGNEVSIYRIPNYCLKYIVRGYKLRSWDKAAFHHERGHHHFDHIPARINFVNQMIQKENVTSFYQAKNREEFLQIPNKKELLDDLVSLHNLYVKHEEEADAFVPEDPTLLAAATKFFTFHAHIKEFSPTHPSEEQRAEYFRNKFKTSIGLRNQEDVDHLINSYAADFSLDLKHSDTNENTPQDSPDFSDEYSIYLALKPLALKWISFN